MNRMKKQSVGWNLVQLILIALIALISICADASPWREDRPITVGHRGTTLLADENTIEAYKVAWEHGIDVFECDPRLTADGVYIIMHDETVDRTTDGQGKVEDLTLEQIKGLRTKSGHSVPTLEEALLFARQHSMGVYLDIKEPPPDEGKLLVKIIEDTGMLDRVIAGCYHKKTIRMIEKLEPEISTCVAWPAPALTLGQARNWGADAVGTLIPFATKLNIERAHRKGLKMISMPINEKQKLETLIERGLDGLQSDDPRLIEPYGKGRNKQ